MQSVLVLPLVVPPATETVADAVPASDGGFLAAFAEDLSGGPDVSDANDSPVAVAPILPWPLPIVPGGLGCAAAGDPDGLSATAVTVEGVRDQKPTATAVRGEAIAGGAKADPVAPAVVDAMSLPEVPAPRNEAAAEGVFLKAPRSDLSILKEHEGRPVAPQGEGAVVAKASTVDQPVEAVVFADTMHGGDGKTVNLLGPVEGKETRPERVSSPEPLVSGWPILGQGSKAGSGPMPETELKDLASRPIVRSSAGRAVVDMAADRDLGSSGLPLADVPETASTLVTSASGSESSKVKPLFVSGSVAGPSADETGIEDLPPTGTAASSVLALDDHAQPSEAEPAFPDDQPRSDQPLRAQDLPAGPVTRPPVAGFWERLFSGLTAEIIPSEKPLGEAIEDTTPVRLSEAGETDISPIHRLKPLSANPVSTVGPSLVSFAGQGIETPDPLANPRDDEGPDAALPIGSPPGMANPVSIQIGPSASNSPSIPHVAGQIAAALSQSADGATELALSPEELGQVRLRLERDAKHPDRMVVMITFERPETLDLFRRHAGELADALRAAGYAGAEIGFGQLGGGSQGADRNPGAPGFGHDYEPGVSPVAEAAPTPVSARRPVTGASLDLRL